MRWAVLAVMVLGCEASGVRSNELPPSKSSPVAVAPGTLVIETWQFRNDCTRTRDIALWRDDSGALLGGNEATAPGQVFQAEVRCWTGDVLCYGGTDSLKTTFPAALGCGACAPGVRPALPIGCE
jgi:hypothetical protein